MRSTVHETDVNLVHQGGSLEGMGSALVPKVPPGDTPQLVVKERHKAVQCLGIAAAPLIEEAGDVERVGHTCASYR